MRSTLSLLGLAGYVAAQSSTVSVWDMEILRHFDQTMMGTIITEMPQATVLAYSCPDEIGCGTATITNGTSTFDATLVTSDVPGEAPGTMTEYIKCGVTGGTSADCSQTWVTVTNGQTGTILTSTTAESEIYMMEVVVPMTGGGGSSSTAYPTATPTTTKAPSTYVPPPVTSASSNCTTPVSTTQYSVPPSGSPTGITTTPYTTPAPGPTGGNGTTPPATTSAPPENVGATRAVGVFAAVGAAFGAAAFAL